MIKIRDLAMAYGGEGKHGKALEGVNADIEKGKIHALIGPSGCGKTTLLYILGGLLTPTRGTIDFGEGLRREDVQIGMVLQEYGLFPWKTVWNNITLGMQIRKRPKEEIRRKGEEILASVGIPHLKNAYPQQLSGGQRQRVALARVWILEPELLLMDEPFSALDALSREEIQAWFLKMWERKKMTTLLVTHNIEEAVALGHTIMIMSPGPGRITETLENPLRDVENPREHPEFYPLCSQIRELLKKGGEGE